MTLGGFVCIRNGFRLDYCFQEAVKSLLPICKEVVICDCDSDDGTGEFIREWATREPRLTIANFPWTDPKGDTNWYPEWLNYARQHLSTQHCIYLDADEVLHEKSYEIVERAALFGSAHVCRRLNFWRDAAHLIPNGHCCGRDVIRVGPANTPFPSDYPYEPAAKIMQIATLAENIEIYHYGFLRKREAFFNKAKEVQRIWVNSYDPRLAAAEKHEGNWMEMDGVSGWEKNLEDFTGTHPKIIHSWLTERGYEIQPLRTPGQTCCAMA